MKITASDLLDATEVMSNRKEQFKKEHPEEKMKVCPLCNNTGLIKKTFNEFYEEDENGVYDYFFPCECVKGSQNTVAKNNKRYSSVPQKFKNATFDDFNPQIYRDVHHKERADNCKKMAIKFCINIETMIAKGKGLYIYSKSRGSGKTMLASIICNELNQLGHRTKFSSASDVVSEISESWKSKDISEKSVIDRYTQPQILVLDDIGVRNGDWVDERFFMVIDARYRENKTTIFTSNYEIDRLPFKDLRIIDRISDTEKFLPLWMPDESIRKQERGGDFFS